MKFFSNIYLYVLWNSSKKLPADFQIKRTIQKRIWKIQSRMLSRSPDSPAMDTYTDFLKGFTKLSPDVPWFGIVSMSSMFTKFLMLSLSSFSSFSFYLSPYHANVARGSVTKVGGNVREHLVWNTGCTGNKTYFAGGVWSRETCHSPQKAVGRETPEGFKI